MLNKLSPKKLFAERPIGLVNRTVSSTNQVGSTRANEGGTAELDTRLDSSLALINSEKDRSPNDELSRRTRQDQSA